MLHIDNSYVYDGRTYDPDRLFRLEGTDQPGKRAKLLRDLSELMPMDDLSALI